MADSHSLPSPAFTRAPGTPREGSHPAMQAQRRPSLRASRSTSNVASSSTSLTSPSSSSMSLRRTRSRADGMSVNTKTHGLEMAIPSLSLLPCTPSSASGLPCTPSPSSLPLPSSPSPPSSSSSSPSPPSSAPTSISGEEAHRNPDAKNNHYTLERLGQQSITKPRTKRYRPPTPGAPGGLKPSRSFSFVPFPAQAPSPGLPNPTLQTQPQPQPHTFSEPTSGFASLSTPPRPTPRTELTPPSTPRRKASLASPLPPNTPMIPCSPTLGAFGVSKAGGIVRMGGADPTFGAILSSNLSSNPVSPSISPVSIRPGKRQDKDKSEGQPHQGLSTTTFSTLHASSAPSNADTSRATMADSVPPHLSRQSPGDGLEYGHDKPPHTNTQTLMVPPHLDITAMNMNTHSNALSSSSSSPYSHIYTGMAQHPSASTSTLGTSGHGHGPPTPGWSSHAQYASPLKIGTGLGTSTSSLPLPESPGTRAMMKRLLAKPAPPSPSAAGVVSGSDSEGFAVGYKGKKIWQGRVQNRGREGDRERGYVWEEEEGGREAVVRSDNGHEREQERSPLPRRRAYTQVTPAELPPPMVKPPVNFTLLDQTIETLGQWVEADARLARKSSTGSKKQRNVLRRANNPNVTSLRNLGSIPNPSSNSVNSDPTKSNTGVQPKSAPALISNPQTATERRVADTVVDANHHRDQNHDHKPNDKKALRRSASASGGFAISVSKCRDRVRDREGSPLPLPLPPRSPGPAKTKTRTTSPSHAPDHPSASQWQAPSQWYPHSAPGSRGSSPGASPVRTRARGKSPVVGALRSLVGSVGSRAGGRRHGSEPGSSGVRKVKGEEGSGKERGKGKEKTKGKVKEVKEEGEYKTQRQAQARSQDKEEEQARGRERRREQSSLTPAGALIEAYKRRQVEAEKLKADLAKSVEVEVWDDDKLLAGAKGKSKSQLREEPSLLGERRHGELEVDLDLDATTSHSSDDVITLSMAMATAIQGPSRDQSRGRSLALGTGVGLKFPTSGSVSPLETLRPASPSFVPFTPVALSGSGSGSASGSDVKMWVQPHTRTQSQTPKPPAPSKTKLLHTVFSTAPSQDPEDEMYNYEQEYWAGMVKGNVEKKQTKAKDGTDQGEGDGKHKDGGEEKAKQSPGRTCKLSGRKRKGPVNEDEGVGEGSADTHGDEGRSSGLSVERYPAHEHHEFKPSEQPETPRAGGGVFWRLVKKISVGGGLRERYHESASASSSASAAEPEAIPPVPALPAAYAHAFPSSPNRAAKRSKHPEEGKRTDKDKDKDRSGTSGPVLSSPASGRKTPSRPSNLVTRSSSPVTVSSSDKASGSSKFFNRTMSAGWSSASSLGEEVPPVPTTVLMLAKHIIPPSELVKIDSDDDASRTASIPVPIKRKASMGVWDKERGGEGDAPWMIVRSPEMELPSLPLPPRKGNGPLLASSGWTRRKPAPKVSAEILLEAGLKPEDAEGSSNESGEGGEGETKGGKIEFSPTIPEFSNSGVINTFPRKESILNMAMTSGAAQLQLPPRPLRSTHRPHPLVSLTRAPADLPLVRVVPYQDDEDDEGDIHLGSGGVTNANTVSMASTSRDTHHSYPHAYPHRRSTSFSVGPGSPREHQHQRHISSPVTPNFPSPSFPAYSHSRSSSHSHSHSLAGQRLRQHSSSATNLSLKDMGQREDLAREQEKADKWAALLQRSDRAGGTLHLAGGERVLASERLSVGGFRV